MKNEKNDEATDGHACDGLDADDECSAEFDADDPPPSFEDALAFCPPAGQLGLETSHDVVYSCAWYALRDFLFLAWLIPVACVVAEAADGREEGDDTEADGAEPEHGNGGDKDKSALDVLLSLGFDPDAAATALALVCVCPLVHIHCFRCQSLHVVTCHHRLAASLRKNVFDQLVGIDTVSVHVSMDL